MESVIRNSPSRIFLRSGSSAMRRVLRKGAGLFDISNSMESMPKHGLRQGGNTAIHLLAPAWAVPNRIFND